MPSTEARPKYTPPKNPDFDYSLSLGLADADAEIAGIVAQEGDRQRYQAQLIASENVASVAVREATGSVLTSKYAEGYPAKRYYGGCEVVDLAESVARDRAKALFGAEHANVQPHSGSQANMAAYLSILKPGDTILAMRLDQGGHLTHGSPVNFSGLLFNVVAYGVHEDTERIDYDEVARLAREHKPGVIVAGATAYPRQIDFDRFAEIAEETGARFMVDMAHIAGLVATDLHPDPVLVADIVTSTTQKTLRGPRGGVILCKQELAKAVDSAVFPRTQGGPLEHVIAAKAVCFAEAMKPSFRQYQERVIANAQVLAEAMASLGFRIVTGGTDNHLVLVDLRPKGVKGNSTQNTLDRAGITANRNLIPFDPEKPFVTSGLRLGTPFMTSRGWGAAEFTHLAFLINEVVGNIGNEAVEGAVRQEVRDLCSAFPMPGDQPAR